MSNRTDILKTAGEAICGDRARDYGDAKQNFSCIAAFWEVILDTPVSPEQVAMCMTAVKLARLKHSPNHLDSWIDITGYGALGGEVSSD